MPLSIPLNLYGSAVKISFFCIGSRQGMAGSGIDYSVAWRLGLRSVFERLKDEDGVNLRMINLGGGFRPTTSAVPTT